MKTISNACVTDCSTQTPIDALRSPIGENLNVFVHSDGACMLGIDWKGEVPSQKTMMKR